MGLHDLLEASCRKWGGNRAVVEGASSLHVTYRELGCLSDRVRDRLVALGVGRGDRVGLYMRKSVDTVAAIFGVLKSGAAYVPVDPMAPASRNAYIHDNCQVKAVLVERRFEAAYREELGRLRRVPPMLVLDDVAGGAGLGAALDAADKVSPAPAAQSADSHPDDLAYILYTSGSTGKPKGVMLSHRNAVSFVTWCSEVFDPQPTDVFSSHAPFHFDLSILDLYASLKHGAALVLVPEEAAKQPLALSKLIAGHRITVWYSAPSILSLIGEFGKIREHDFSNLRHVIFAGEVFPVAHLRSFKRQVPHPRYFNLYGPTETNVCTWFEVPGEIPDDRTDPYPIGKTCAQLEGVVVDGEGKKVQAGGEGELCIAGPNVMQGYWAMPAQTEQSFLAVNGTGRRWYKTGDIVAEDADGNYRYLGRRDRMIKKHGYRVELGEIEACLYTHADIREAAVVALAGEGGTTVKAHLSMRSEKRPSLIELKTFCSRNLPLYMVPDAFAFHESLPKTSTSKVDYVALKNLG